MCGGGHGAIIGAIPALVALWTPVVGAGLLYWRFKASNKEPPTLMTSYLGGTLLLPAFVSLTISVVATPLLFGLAMQEATSFQVALRGCGIGIMMALTMYAFSLLPSLGPGGGCGMLRWYIVHRLRKKQVLGCTQHRPDGVESDTSTPAATKRQVVSITFLSLLGWALSALFVVPMIFWMGYPAYSGYSPPL